MQPVEFSAYWQLCGRPSRVVWAVAQWEGQRSICPLGWKMNTSIAPPMMAISVAPARFTHDLIARSGEFVFAWPGEDLAEATLFCGTNSGRDVDKFAAAKLTARPATHVRAPLIAECVLNMECRLAGTLTTGDHTIFAGEVLAVWAHEHPKKALCTIGREEGYQLLLEDSRYRFGVVRG